MYVEKPAEFHEDLQKIGLWGVLKNKDRHGRRVVCVHGCKLADYFNLIEIITWEWY